MKYNDCRPLGTIKASQVVVNSMIITSNWIWLCWETYTLKMVFVEHHTHFYVNISQWSQIQFEDKDHAVYIRFCWVTTTCLCWEPQPVKLWLYPVVDGREQFEFSVQVQCHNNNNIIFRGCWHQFVRLLQIGKLTKASHNNMFIFSPHKQDTNCFCCCLFSFSVLNKLTIQNMPIKKECRF